ncbi:MAG: hypothetical protein FJ109_18625 [Deltaproteobacteria bacterium]|nr:hypothetical protein [Deltaproteobacteria bacterium]
MLQLIMVGSAVLLPVVWLALDSPSGVFDLGPAALVGVGSVRSPGGNVDDRWEGPLALHDGDPSSAWRPAQGLPAELTARIQGLAGDGIRLTRVRMRFLSDPVMPELVEWAGRPIPEGACTTDGRSVVCRVPSRTGRWLRIRLPAMAEEKGITALELEAEPTLPPAPPAPVVRPWKRGLSVTAAPVPGACRLEVRRTEVGGAEHVFPLAFGARSGLDRPGGGRVGYSVRAVGLCGTPGPWSETTWTDFGEAVRPPIPLFGVVEGFYGRPWTWDERMGVLRLMAALGMNHYVYAPKDDPLHREQWRVPCPAAELSHLACLLREAQALSLEASFGISPGLSMVPDSEADFEALTGKLASVVALGFTSVTLLMDDIKAAKEARVGASHARLTRRLSDHLSARGVKLQFVGTVYAGTARSLAPEHRAYLEELAALPAEVPVMWTGDSVFDAVMEPDDASGIARIIGRPPLVWDNFPVNDYASRSQRLLLGPVTGRTAELFGEIHGLLSNPMTHAAASCFSLVSYGELVKGEGRAGEGPPAEDLAIAFGLPVEAGELLARFARDHEGSPKLLPGRSALPELSRLSERFLAALDRDDQPTALELASRIVRELLQRYQDDLRGLLAVSPSLADDLFAPVTKRGAQIEAALEAVSLLASGELHPWGPCRWRTLIRRYRPAPLDWKWFGLEEALQPLLERALERYPVQGPGTDGDCADRDTLPGEAVVSEPVRILLVQRAASYELLGDGVRPTDDGGLVAERPGLHRVAVVASGPQVVAVSGFELFAREAPCESEGGAAGPPEGGPR